jgi:hypothetical protein
MQTFTTRATAQTHMFLDACAWGIMKIKLDKEVRELIENMSLNKYCSQSIDKTGHMKRGILNLDTHDVLLTFNKLLSIQLEVI